MVLLGLSAESCDHVCCQAAVRNNAADLRNPLQIPLAVVFAAHLLQHDAAAGLDRQVDVLADVLIHRHCVDDLVADVLRVRRRESDTELRAYLGHHLEQLGEIDIVVCAPAVLPKV